MSSKKHAEAKPALTEWVVHLNGSPRPSLAVAASRIMRDQYGGYSFTAADGIIADFPPGTVEYVTRKPRVTITVSGSTNAVFGAGGSGSTGTGAVTASAGHGAGGDGGTGAAMGSPEKVPSEALTPGKKRAAALAAEMGVDPAAPMTPGQHSEFASRFEPVIEAK